jgi:hypothetical protein
MPAVFDCMHAPPIILSAFRCMHTPRSSLFVALARASSAFNSHAPRGGQRSTLNSVPSCCPCLLVNLLRMNSAPDQFLQHLFFCANRTSSFLDRVLTLLCLQQTHASFILHAINISFFPFTLTRPVLSQAAKLSHNQLLQLPSRIKI